MTVSLEGMGDYRKNKSKNASVSLSNLRRTQKQSRRSLTSPKSRYSFETVQLYFHAALLRMYAMLLAVASW